MAFAVRYAIFLFFACDPTLKSKTVALTINSQQLTIAQQSLFNQRYSEIIVL